MTVYNVDLNNDDYESVEAESIDVKEGALLFITNGVTVRMFAPGVWKDVCLETD